MNISEMVARNARMYPGESALVEIVPSRGLRKEVTWYEFDQRINRIANALLGHGIGRGDRVIHWMMNSICWLEVYFGILRTGAWAVPLNFRFSHKDLRHCIEVAEARTIILGEDFIERVASIQADMPALKECIVVSENECRGMERLEDFIGDAVSAAPEIALSEEDEAALYFTSGTTGAPKPILLTHKNLASACITESFRMGTRHDDNMLMMPPLYHTGTKMHWLGHLVVGGRGTILPEFSPANFFEAVQNEGITDAFILVPWMLDTLVALEKGEIKVSDYNVSSLRLIYSGAQPVPASVIEHWKHYLPGVPFQVTYGLSESTGPGCVFTQGQCPDGSIGKAGFNWEVRIVDDHGQPLPVGQTGEICVRGDGVMKEYYKNPEQTAATLKNGWLFTGDMGRMDEQGCFVIVDRKKDVIIYGGENVYPKEIEAVLMQHEKIFDLAVIGVPDTRLGEIPVAVINPKPDMTLTEEEVFQFCDEQNLPRYRRPRRIIFDIIPRSATGKIEKLKLKEKYAGPPK